MTTTTPTADDISVRVLACPLPEDNDASAATVRDYLLALLTEVWVHEEGFSGKRPFGNSGWQYDLYGPLIEAGLIEGTIDDVDDVEVSNITVADRVIVNAIKSLAGVPVTAPAPHPDRAEQTEVVHACPPAANAVTPCCGRTPFELLRSDRMTADPGLVTCTGRAEQTQPGGYPGGLVDPNCARLGGTCGADCRHSGCQRGAPGYTPPAVGAPTWSRQANLGCATTQELLEELRARIEIDYYAGGGGLGYSTVTGRPSTGVAVEGGDQP